MSKFILKENCGNLFRADKQKPEDRDYRGELNVSGRQFWVSGWKKTTKNGDPFLSLSLKAKDESKQTTTAARPPLKDDLDDQIPF